MTIAGISQATWKWIPSLWISDHWSIDGEDEEAEDQEGEADLKGQADPAAARRARAEPRPRLTDPVQKWLAALHVSRTLVTRAAPTPRRHPPQAHGSGLG